MLIEIFSSDNFLYPLYLAIKTVYLPAILLGGNYLHLLAEQIAVVVFCVLVAFLNATSISRWMQLALIAAGWALLGNTHAGAELVFSLPVWPFLFWKRRYWGLALALFGVAFCTAVNLLLLQLDQQHYSQLNIYVGVIAFVVVRVKFVFFKRFRAPFIALAFIFLAFYSAPIIYEKYGAPLLAKQAFMRPKITWLKEPQKGEKITTVQLNNTKFNDKFYQNITIIFQENDKLWWQIVESNKIPDDLEIYGYKTPGIFANDIDYNQLIKNDFDYQNFKDFLFSSVNRINHKKFIKELYKKY